MQNNNVNLQTCERTNPTEKLSPANGLRSLWLSFPSRRMSVLAHRVGLFRIRPPLAVVRLDLATEPVCGYRIPPYRGYASINIRLMSSIVTPVFFGADVLTGAAFTFSRFVRRTSETGTPAFS